MEGSIKGSQEFKKEPEQIKARETSPEKSLHESEHLYHTIMDSMTDAIHIIDKHLQIIFVNKQLRLWLEQFGLPQDISDRQLYEAFPFLSEKVREEYIRVFETGKAVITEEKTKIGQAEFSTQTQKLPVINKGQVANVVTIIRDLTEIKKIQATLSSEKNKLQSLIDSMEYGLTLLDREYNILFQNEFMKNIFGNARGKCYCIYESHDHVCDGCQVELSFKDGMSHKTERNAISPSGEVKILDIISTPIKDDEGNIAACFEITQDITERRHTEDALRRSEKLLNDILDGSPIPQFVIGRDHMVLKWNKALEEYTGVMSEDVIGTDRQWFPFYKEKRPVMADLLIDGAIEKIPQLYAGKYAKSGLVEGAYEGTDFFPALGKEGKWLYFTASVIKDSEGKVVGAVETLEDITERKHQEEALLKSYALLKGVIESPRNVVILALDRQYRYIAFNKNHHQTMKRIWGIDITLGNSMLEYIKNPDDRQKAKLNFDRALSGESFIIIEEYGDTLLERRYYEDIYNPIIDENGDIIGLTLFLTDITERKREEEEREKLQSQLSQAQKMESVGRLAGGVAHDFNNMLGVIIGYTELIMNQLGTAHPLYANMQEIRKAAVRSADLTRQLLAFARKQTVSPRLLNLNETVESTLKMLRRMIGEDIDLAWLPSAKIWPVNMDPSQVDQILANLCVNARDAISGIGRITIETHTATIDESYCAGHPDAAPGEYVVLAVSDNGSGMDKETLNKLFEPFFTTKESGKGTGLGLATVYGIVKQNNGFINVYSEPGHGTTFKICLPRHPADIRQIQEEAQAIPTSLGNETILIVEDETAILDIERLMLENLGYSVLTASSPLEALRTAREHAGEIQLVITDVIMPEMNGRELAKNLISFYPGIKLLFMSGYTGNVIAHHGVLDEGVHFIQKPFSIQDLASKVREALDAK